MRNIQDWIKVFESISAGHNPNSIQALNQSFYEAKDFFKNDIIHPHDKVLDIGSGNGRQAVALEQYKIDKYVGIEPIKESVDFCKNAFKELEEFDFIHIDLHNETYNPTGAIDPLEMQIPYRDGYFDTVIAGSLFTHLGTIEACKRYIKEINRVLKPRGKFFSSWFCSPPNQLSSGHDRTVLDKSKILQILSKHFKIYHTYGGTTTDCNDQWCIYAQKINSLKSDRYEIMSYIEEPSTGGNIEDFVNRFYLQCLGRDEDASELEGLVSALTDGSLCGADIAYRIILSQEFIERNTINEDFVTILYRAFFEREPDPDGYDGWMNFINGGASRQEVLNGFIYSPEFENLCNTYGIAPYSA